MYWLSDDGIYQEHFWNVATTSGMTSVFQNTNDFYTSYLYENTYVFRPKAKWIWN